MKERLTVSNADIMDFDCDVLVLKFAQELYGADAAVMAKLPVPDLQKILPRPGDFFFLGTDGCIAARAVLLVGVPPLSQFDYSQIREFAARSLQILSENYQGPLDRIAMTVHGVRYGLDERESFLAQLAGILDAFQRKYFAARVASITIVENDRSRALRLKTTLLDNFPQEFSGEEHASQRVTALAEAGSRSESKPHVFVAMPFTEEMEDVYFFGIQAPVNDAGFLCERVDLTTFTGDVLDRIKSRIETADLVIADLTGANPNVYLEVGYAWGKNRRTLLLANHSDELKFDVQSQRTLTYKNITDLSSKLRADLSALK